MNKLKKVIMSTSIALLMSAQLITTYAIQPGNNLDEVGNQTDTTFTEFTQELDKSMPGNRTFVLNRGSFLLWSKDRVNFQFNGQRIYSSNGSQETGWIFPNYIEPKGIRRISSSSVEHIYEAKKYVSAGIPTPWGNIGIYGRIVVDFIKVFSNGTARWW